MLSGESLTLQALQWRIVRADKYFLANEGITD